MTAALLRFDALGEREPRDARQESAHGGWLLCAACRGAVTPSDARIVVAGAHEHRFVNPHGIHYRIGCFDRAPGCAAHGAPTTAWSWFEGFAWLIAECRGCGTHLGWLFEPLEPSDAPFFGLILARLCGPAS